MSECGDRQEKIFKYYDLSAEAGNCCHAWSSSILNYYYVIVICYM